MCVKICLLDVLYHVCMVVTQELYLGVFDNFMIYLLPDDGKDSLTFYLYHRLNAVN